MNLLKTHIFTILNQDLLLKSIYKNSESLPKLVKLTLSSKFNDHNKGALNSILQILTFLRPYLSQSSSNSLSFNLKKGEVVGCKLVLRKNHGYDFLERFVLEMLPYLKNHGKFKANGKFIHIQLKDLFLLDDTSNLYMYFQSLSSLDLVIETTKPNPNFYYGLRLPLSKT